MENRKNINVDDSESYHLSEQADSMESAIRQRNFYDQMKHKSTGDIYKKDMHDEDSIENSSVDSKKDVVEDYTDLDQVQIVE